MIRNFVLAMVALGVVAFGLVWLAGRGVFGDPEEPGLVTEEPRPRDTVRRTDAAVQRAADEIGVARPKQVLFGDLHVHTTFSFDAFTFSLPLMQGEGAHPPADACDFARYCSALDFWSINDHAFSITPDEWRQTVESIRQCNAVGNERDTVAFLGWEWTQVGTTPDDHYGHKNVILAGTEDDEVPPRPIAALRGGLGNPPVLSRGLAALLFGGRMHDLVWMFAESESRPECPAGVHTSELPPDCMEGAATPADLYRKLAEWGGDALVIPHGTTWGFYTPPGSTWDKQLQGDMHDPARQRLIEIYSGHGDSEVYRDFRAVDVADDGSLSCPEPSEGYLPSCWRAGEIIRERCLAEGTSEARCEERAVTARQHAALARIAIMGTVPGSSGSDWLDAGQCRDCDEPSFNYRPGGSAQYILALGGFDEDPNDPRRFRMGFMASSDNHYARPGTGYKEVHRRGMTESMGLAGDTPAGVAGPLASMLVPEPEEPAASSRAIQVDQLGFNVFETERQMSFFLTGGLIAAHAEGRDRGAIWDAMQRREVYGTSGPRILLWFDLLNPPGSRGRGLPMGGEVEMAELPIFQARAVGSFQQQPGCPDYATGALGPERLEHICKGECYNPGETRRTITRIEVVRIRPQVSQGEDVGSLIDDPWKSFACEPGSAGCAVTFSDAEFAGAARDAVYYVRAYEEPAPGINAGNVRCSVDDEGRCSEVDLCPGRTDANPDCLAEHEPRAWSSPIYVDFARSGS